MDRTSVGRPSGDPVLIYLILMYRRRWLQAEARVFTLTNVPTVVIDVDPTRGHDYGMDPELNATLNSTGDAA